MRKVEPKKPLDRMLLRSFKNEKQYVSKLEYIIIEQGKRVLGSLNINHIIVSDEDIQKFITKYPEFFNTRWHQIGIERLYNERLIDTFQYELLITMKQALNKNGSYILRSDEFDNRLWVMKCKRYENKKVPCVQEECKIKLDCPLYHPETINVFRAGQKGGEQVVDTILSPGRLGDHKSELAKGNDFCSPPCKPKKRVKKG
jgi:hypothetical protein